MSILCLFITLIAYENKHQRRRTICFSFLYPFSYMCKAFSIWDIKDNNSSYSISIISSSDSLEGLLSSLNQSSCYCIPYLQFYIVFCKFKHLSSKLYSYGYLVFFSISLISILQQSAWFPNTCIIIYVPESPIIMYLRRNE